MVRGIELILQSCKYFLGSWKVVTCMQHNGCFMQEVHWQHCIGTNFGISCTDYVRENVCEENSAIIVITFSLQSEVQGGFHGQVTSSAT